MKNKIIVALDVDSEKKAVELVKKLSPYVGGFKFGPRLTFRCDKSFLKDVSQSGILFFDHKFFDIPSTTAAAVEVAAELGAHWVTVHALNGSECLNKISEVEFKIKNQITNFRVLAVTVLTSFSEKNLPSIWQKQSLQKSVTDLAEDAFASGLSSIVCSPEEIESLKALNKNSFLVVPGIRPSGSGTSDQVRVATPSMAVTRGADALVIGRPIIESSDPVRVAKEISDTL
jgi:orotidine-5'-phosphate decarboxylase